MSACLATIRRVSYSLESNVTAIRGTLSTAVVPPAAIHTALELVGTVLRDVTDLKNAAGKASELEGVANGTSTVFDDVGAPLEINDDHADRVRQLEKELDEHRQREREMAEQYTSLFRRYEFLRKSMTDARDVKESDTPTPQDLRELLKKIPDPKLKTKIGDFLDQHDALAAEAKTLREERHSAVAGFESTLEAMEADYKRRAAAIGSDYQAQLAAAHAHVSELERLVELAEARSETVRAKGAVALDEAEKAAAEYRGTATAEIEQLRIMLDSSRRQHDVQVAQLRHTIDNLSNPQAPRAGAEPVTPSKPSAKGVATYTPPRHLTPVRGSASAIFGASPFGPATPPAPRSHHTAVDASAGDEIAALTRELEEVMRERDNVRNELESFRARAPVFDDASRAAETLKEALLDSLAARDAAADQFRAVEAECEMLDGTLRSATQELDEALFALSRAHAGGFRSPRAVRRRAPAFRRVSMPGSPMASPRGTPSPLASPGVGGPAFAPSSPALLGRVDPRMDELTQTIQTLKESLLDALVVRSDHKQSMHRLKDVNSRLAMITWQPLKVNVPRATPKKAFPEDAVLPAGDTPEDAVVVSARAVTAMKTRLLDAYAERLEARNDAEHAKNEVAEIKSKSRAERMQGDLCYCVDARRARYMAYVEKGKHKKSEHGGHNAAMSLLETVSARAQTDMQVSSAALKEGLLDAFATRQKVAKREAKMREEQAKLALLAAEGEDLLLEEAKTDYRVLTELKEQMLDMCMRRQDDELRVQEHFESERYMEKQYHNALHMLRLSTEDLEPVWSMRPGGNKRMTMMGLPPAEAVPRRLRDAPAKVPGSDRPAAQIADWHAKDEGVRASLAAALAEKEKLATELARVKKAFDGLDSMVREVCGSETGSSSARDSPRSKIASGYGDDQRELSRLLRSFKDRLEDARAERDDAHEQLASLRGETRGRREGSEPAGGRSPQSSSMGKKSATPARAAAATPPRALPSPRLSERAGSEGTLNRQPSDHSGNGYDISALKEFALDVCADRDAQKKALRFATDEIKDLSKKRKDDTSEEHDLLRYHDGTVAARALMSDTEVANLRGQLAEAHRLLDAHGINHTVADMPANEEVTVESLWQQLRQANSVIERLQSEVDEAWSEERKQKARLEVVVLASKRRLADARIKCTAKGAKMSDVQDCIAAAARELDEANVIGALPPSPRTIEALRPQQRRRRLCSVDSTDSRSSRSVDRSVSPGNSSAERDRIEQAAELARTVQSLQDANAELHTTVAAQAAQIAQLRSSFVASSPAPLRSPRSPSGGLRTPRGGESPVSAGDSVRGTGAEACATLRQLLREREKEAADLGVEVDALRSQNAALREALDSSTQSVAAMKEAVEGHASTLAQYRRSNAVQAEAFRALGASGADPIETETLREELDTKTSLLADMLGLVATLRSENTEMHATIESQTATIGLLKAGDRAQRDTIAALTVALHSGRDASPAVTLSSPARHGASPAVGSPMRRGLGRASIGMDRGTPNEADRLLGEAEQELANLHASANVQRSSLLAGWRHEFADVCRRIVPASPAPQR